MGASPDPAYSLQGVRYRCPGSADGFALEIGSPRVETASVMALVGPNGAGKTTLLTLLALLARPAAGRLSFFGRDAWEPGADDHPVVRRDAVLVTHHPYLFKGTVGKNLAFGLKVRGVPETEWPARMKEALALVELPGWESRPAGGLSAGQAQRIALARALALRPKVLLLDEPTANIEAGLGLRIEAVIGESVREAGTTVVFSTHNFSQASRLAGEILFLSEGKKFPFSHENCFSGTAATDGVRSWIEPGRGSRIVFAGKHSGHVTCVIDPAKIRIDRPGGTPVSEAGVNSFAGTVTRLEMTEGGVLVRVSGDLTFRAILPLAEVQEKRIALAGPVLIRFAPEAVEIIAASLPENTA